MFYLSLTIAKEADNESKLALRDVVLIKSKFDSLAENVSNRNFAQHLGRDTNQHKYLDFIAVKIADICNLCSARSEIP